MQAIFNWITLGFGILIGFCLLYSSIVSYKENEKYASRILALLFLIVISPFIINYFLDFEYKIYFTIALSVITTLGIILLFLPIKKKLNPYQKPNKRLDERDIMFSRHELSVNTNEYNEYYKLRPENKEIDTHLKGLPGLLSEKSNLYNEIAFKATRTSLNITKHLQEVIDGNVAEKKLNTEPSSISYFIKEWTKQLGALDVGITKLKDYHLYSHKGRAPIYGKEIEHKHEFAIAFTIEMDKHMLDAAPEASSVMESTNKYVQAAIIAVQLADFIRNLGYEAKAHIDGNYELVCPLVARDAGLGEIGRMGLLMTPKLGPRVRIAVVTTNLNLIPDANKFDSSAIDFCTICKKCAEVCPSNAIQKDDRQEIDGINRWQINSEKCFEFWCKYGTDCGRCVSVCPYSHPDNAMHKFVRFGIKNSMIFSRFALKMDKLIYGSKPKSKRQPDWIPIKNTAN